ncbi:MAG: YkgJ family cysteine cluster protein, partial [Deltaproteobacteria bacterium]|nr:YkgJ family cysteine cluster protein [Deltaproteobacteria bacterium]
QFRKRYLANGEEAGEFIFKEKPCPFLKNNLCSHYNYRPQACRSYPHLHKNNIVFRLIGVIQNSSVCPIVFNVYEYLKAELWHINDFD